MLERRLELTKDTYIDFIELEKAFDNVHWMELFQIMNDVHLDWKDRRTITNLYKKQKTTIDTNGHQHKAKIRKDVRQRYSLSLYLFTLFI